MNTFKPLFYFISLVTAIIFLASVILTPIQGEEWAGWKTYTATVGPLSTDPTQTTYDFNIPYRIINGTGTFQVHDYAFTANIYSKTNGLFEINIPRNFPYYTGKAGPSIYEKYIVIENGVNITSSKYTKTNDCFFVYSIPFHMNSTIEIVSTNTLSLVTPIYGDKVSPYCMSETIHAVPKIPEFPYTIPILAASITSLIAFYRIKFR